MRLIARSVDPSVAAVASAVSASPLRVDPDPAAADAPPSDGPADPATYAAVARAIAWLQRHALQQPTLAEVAAAVGLGESTLQRAFSRFAGVSPKRFLQYLSKEHAKRALAESKDVLAAAFAAGLSGPGRLHDLLVSCEAMTPGEMRRGGEGVDLRYAFGDTPLGRALAATTPRGLCFLGFVDDDEGGDAGALADLGARWPAARPVPDDAVRGVLERAFAGWSGTAAGRPLHLVLAGTNLQLQVWEALLRLPEGAITTYGRLAEAVGRPSAVRAVASAVGRNPISVLIPCHRVLRDGGALGGYRWGLPRKAALLAWEAARGEQRAA